jgi:hypothetical protein
MEVRHAVVIEVHGDDDPEEARDCRHASIVTAQADRSPPAQRFLGVSDGT